MADPEKPDWWVPFVDPPALQDAAKTEIGSHQRLELELVQRLLDNDWLPTPLEKAEIDKFQTWLRLWLLEHPQASNPEIYRAANKYFGARGRVTDRMVRDERKGEQPVGRKPGKRITPA